jgi:AraC family transcriptional regulator
VNQREGKIVKNNASHIKRMKRVMAHIEAHLDENPTLKELCTIACYSEFHFYRLFSAYVGESIHQYKRRLLLERAISQLRYSAVNITDIALQSGFETASAFNKSFKSRFSYTPSQVRSRHDIDIHIHQFILNGA